MSVRVLQWSQRVLVPHPSSRQRCHVSNGGEPLVCRFPRKLDHRPSLLQRYRSCESTLSTSKIISRFSFSDKEYPENVGDDDYDDHDSNATDQPISDEESSDENDGDGGFDKLKLNHHTILPDGGAQLSEQEERMRQLREEASLRRSIVEAAWNMEDRVDRETMKRFVAPVRVEIEPDDYLVEYFETEHAYLVALFEEPHNPLLPANYAQFLYVVVGDYDRAEEWFERAIDWKEEDAVVRDADAYWKYGEFKWRARKDLVAADTALSQALCLEPNNAYLAAFYAHFLWSTSLL